MKISIGIEYNKTLIDLGFFVYARIGYISILEIFGYAVYRKVGILKSFKIYKSEDTNA